MKCHFLLSLLLLFSFPAFSQIPNTGLLETFDGLDMPYSVVVGNVSVAEDRFGTECAIQFDGELSSLILIQGGPYVTDPDSSLSLSLWYQGGSNDAGDLESLFIKYGNGADPHAYPNYGLQLYDLNTPLMSSPTWSLWADQSGIVFPDDPAWHHLVAVFELGTWTLYMDNAIVGSYAGTQAIIGDGNADIAIGPGFEGKLDDILLYSRALTAAEVTQLFNAGSLCTVGLADQVHDVDVSIFPNPSGDLLELDLNEVACDRLRILDMEGKVCVDRMIFMPYNRIDISNLKTGNYILEFQYQGKTQGHKQLMKGC